MSKCSGHLKSHSLAFLGVMALAAIANAQEAKTLLQIQRSRAELEDQSNTMTSGRNVYSAGMTGQQQLDTRNYPNSSMCVMVYEDGKYVLEKRDEHTVGKPKTKSAEGALAADDLQRLKAILDDEQLKKISSPPALELPSDTQAIREAERVDVQIGRAGISQQFTLMKERVKTGTAGGISSSASLSGVDTYLDNGTPYKKTISPLMKWFDDLAKKGKFTDSKAQRCQ